MNAGQALGCGQAVRRLTLDQEIEGSNPSAPAKPLSTNAPLRESWRGDRLFALQPALQPLRPDLPDDVRCDLQDEPDEEGCQTDPAAERGLNANADEAA